MCTIKWLKGLAIYIHLNFMLSHTNQNHYYQVVKNMHTSVRYIHHMFAVKFIEITVVKPQKLPMHTKSIDKTSLIIFCNTKRLSNDANFMLMAHNNQQSIRWMYFTDYAQVVTYHECLQCLILWHESLWYEWEKVQQCIYLDFTLTVPLPLCVVSLENQL